MSQPTVTTSMTVGPRLTTDLGWGKPSDSYHYTLLSEPNLSLVLENLANASSQTVSSLTVNTASIQPCPLEESRTQDRFSVLEVPGKGVLLSVFDGHAGHEAVDYAIRVLPPLVAQGIQGLSQVDEHGVSSVLRSTITTFDQGLAHDIRVLFPDDEEQLKQLPETEVIKIIEQNQEVISRGMTGSTVLMVFVNQEKTHVWTASVGDCYAVLGTESADGKWKADIISTSHNASVPQQAQAVRDSHPGEEFCVAEDRVLGAIALTRAIGDLEFKLPASYTSHVFLHSPVAFRTSTSVRDVVLPRILTPPYLSGEPDVTYTALSPRSSDVNSSANNKPRQTLILSSDGLIERHVDSSSFDWSASTPEQKADAAATIEREAVQEWVDVAGEFISRQTEGAHSVRQTSAVTETSTTLPGPNMALSVLRHGMSLGGTPAEGETGEEARRRRLSEMLTVELMWKWMDDTTIIALEL